MVIWGGLRPIVGQAVIDAMALGCLSFVVVSSVSKRNLAVLFLTAMSVVLFSGNVTNRWTLMFPMAPLLLLQMLRPIVPFRWIKGVVFLMSILLVLTAGLLSILFPAVEVPRLDDAPYNLGIVDIFLPASFEYSTALEGVEDVCGKGQDHVSVRIMYPTAEKPYSIPHLRPEVSDIFCEETMIAGAPPPLKPFDWILHTWRLASIEARPLAQPVESESALPIIVFSHGLGGNVDLYAYQTTSLARHGYVVVIIDHTDGSAAVVPRKDGNTIRRNDDHVVAFYDEGREDLHLKGRRAMTEYRAEEFLAVVEATVSLNTKNIEELASKNISFVGKLNTDELHYMGHSFGGTTAVHAATKRSATSVIAHEPTSLWMPDETHRNLFDPARLEGSNVDYSVREDHKLDASKLSLHDQNMLFLYSNEWKDKGLAEIAVVEDMFERKVFGSAGGVSKVKVIRDMHHNEFSDSCMLTPLWLARATNITGPRNPLDTALEAHEETLAFLKAAVAPRR